MKTKIFTLVILLSMITMNGLKAQGYVWAQSVGSTSDDVIMTQKTDNSGNHYLCGYFSGPSIQFGSISLTNSNGSSYLPDLYLVKYDAAWNVLWAYSPDNDQEAYGDIYNPVDIDIDDIGNCYLTGSFRIGSITFGSITLQNTNPDGEFDIFVVKFNSGGTVQWAKNFGGMYRDKGRCIAVDPSGSSIYVAGWFYSDTITIDGISYINRDNSLNTSDIFLAKFDANGNNIWAVTNGSDNIDRYQDIATDNNGNIITVGTFKGADISFETHTLNNFNRFFDDAFMVKYTPDGSVTWVVHYRGELNETPTKLFVNQTTGNIYMGGMFNSSVLWIDGQTVLNNYSPGSGTYDGFIVKYLPNGMRYFILGVKGDLDESVTDITSDNDGNVYFTGGFKSNQLHIWPRVVQENTGIEGTSDMYVIKLNNYSQFQWIKTAAGNGDDIGTAIAMDENDVLVFGQSNADVSFNNIQLINHGGYDIFMSRLSQEMNTFSGKIYYDANNNGRLDINEVGVSKVVCQVGDNYYLSGENGNFEIILPEGNYTFTPRPTEFFVADPEAVNFSFSGVGILNDSNLIALHAAVDTAHLEFSIMSLPSLRKGQEFLTYLTFRNSGTVPLDSTRVGAPLLEDMEYKYSTPPEDEITNDSLFWDVFNLQPFEERTIVVHQALDTIISGDTLNFKDSDDLTIIVICWGFWVCHPVLIDIICYYVPDCYEVEDPVTGEITTQCDTVPETDPITGDTTGYVVDSILQCDFYYWPVCNFWRWCWVILIPHDPNEIYVSPSDSLPYTPQQVSARDPLDYTIRFQNTGNDTCFNAVVIDTLDQNLDISTFEMIGASHNYKASLTDRVLRFTFDNILLPDSTTNEPESHAYIKYRIKPYSNLIIGDSICNRADIYFDYEPAVLTNTVVTKVANPTGINENKDNQGLLDNHKVRIAPNPFSQNTTIYLPKDINENTILDIYDMTGRIVKEIQINKANVYTLNRDALKSGMYIYLLKTKSNRIIDKGKIILKQ